MQPEIAGPHPGPACISLSRRPPSRISIRHYNGGQKNGKLLKITLLLAAAGRVTLVVWPAAAWAAARTLELAPPTRIPAARKFVTAGHLGRAFLRLVRRARRSMKTLAVTCSYRHHHHSGNDNSNQLMELLVLKLSITGESSQDPGRPATGQIQLLAEVYSTEAVIILARPLIARTELTTATKPVREKHSGCWPANVIIFI